jgi:general secretion pathway protein J
MPRDQQGFTLLELLIAVTLVAVLMTLLFGGFRLGMRAQERVSSGADRVTQVASLHGFLREQLADARPIAVEREGGSAAIVRFDGRVDALEFLSHPVAAVSVGGLQRLSLRLANDKALILRWSLDIGDRQWSDDGPRELLLLSRVATAVFDYYGAVEPGREPIWTDTWNGMPHLPSLARLRVVFEDGWRMPELVVALRLAPRDGVLPNGQPSRRMSGRRT